GLHGANFATRVPYDKIAIVELGVERIFNQLVIAMIFAFIRECAPPARNLCQIITPNDFEARRRPVLLDFRDSDHSFHRESCSVEKRQASTLGVQITTLNACILLRMWGWVALMIKDDGSRPPSHILRTPGDHHARHPSNQSRVEEANTIQNSQS